MPSAGRMKAFQDRDTVSRKIKKPFILYRTLGCLVLGVYYVL